MNRITLLGVAVIFFYCFIIFITKFYESHTFGSEFDAHQFTRVTFESIGIAFETISSFCSSCFVSVFETAGALLD